MARALAAVGRTARVHVVKRIPPGAGLGGGSADAAAILRWAGCIEGDLAVGLGADVPFCLVGGRALVRGVGEEVEPLPYVDRRFTLLLVPFGVETAAVYRAWDERASTGEGSGPASSSNDLEEAAVAVEPRLAAWRTRLEEVTGRRALLAGSGSTWFVEGSPEEMGLGDRRSVAVGRSPGGRLFRCEPHRADRADKENPDQFVARWPWSTCPPPVVASGWPSTSSCASSCACACGAS